MTTDVIVAGAGPTGLMTACELASRGLTVEVLDRAPAPAAGSRAMGIQPRSLELLDRLGVAARLVSLGRFRLPVRRWSEGPDGEPAGADHELWGTPPSPDSPYGRVLMVPQWRTEAVLREYLADHGTSVHRDVRVTGVRQDGDGVTVDVDGGPPRRASWLVGCDGGSSAVRHALGVPFTGRTDDDLRMLLGDVVVEGIDRDHWHLWNPFVSLCPMPATETFAFHAAMPEPADREPVAADYQRVLDGCGAGHVRVREVRWSSRWRLNVRLAQRYRVGRVFLAGDAAHVHSPAGGQGMNTGIGDAVNLGWKLAAVHAGAPAALLDTYETERLPVAAGVLGLSDRLLARPFEDRRAQEGEEVLQLGVGYRSGPLAVVETGDGPRSGDRAPDAPLRDADGCRVRVFDLLRHPGWTLLGAGTEPPSLPGVRTVTVLPSGTPAGGAGVLSDRAGHFAAAWAPVAGELVLIRPDGHVGLRSTDPDAVRRYLAAAAPVPVG